MLSTGSEIIMSCDMAKRTTGGLVLVSRRTLKSWTPFFRAWVIWYSQV